MLSLWVMKSNFSLGEAVSEGFQHNFRYWSEQSPWWTRNCFPQWKPCFLFLFFKTFYILLISYREEGRGIENQKHQSGAWGCAHNHGTCPWPESNPGHLSTQAATLPTDPNWFWQKPCFNAYKYGQWHRRYESAKLQSFIKQRLLWGSHGGWCWDLKDDFLR